MCSTRCATVAWPAPASASRATCGTSRFRAASAGASDGRRVPHRRARRRRDAAYVPEPVATGPAPWPAFTRVNGELVFDRARWRSAMPRRAVRRRARAASTAPSRDLAQARACARRPGAAARWPTCCATSTARRSAAGSAMPCARPVPAATPTSTSSSRFRSMTVARTGVQGRVVLSGNDVRLRPTTPLLARCQGARRLHAAGPARSPAAAPACSAATPASTAGHRPTAALRFAAQAWSAPTGCAERPSSARWRGWPRR